MARVETIVVGGGLQLSGDVGLGMFLSIANIGPPPAATAASLAGVPIATFDRRSHLILGDGIQILGVGRYTTSAPAGVVLIGQNVELQGGAGTAGSALVVGNGAIVRATGNSVATCVVVGNGASCIIASGINGCTVVGGGATCIDTGSTVIGALCNVSSQLGTAVGSGANIAVSSSNSVAIGDSSASTGQRNTALGSGATASGNDNVVIGQGSTITGSGLRNICIRGGVPSGFSDTVTLAATAFASNVFMVGSTTSIMNTVCIGKGNQSATPNSVTHRQTDGIGTDIAGGNYIIQAGLGTGAGLPGDVQLTVGVAVASSATLQLARQAVVARYSAVAADTLLMVWDVNGAALKRVSVGANDSGGVGFKLLRIAN
jgi:hypothetical protein